MGSSTNDEPRCTDEQAGHEAVGEGGRQDVRAPAAFLPHKYIMISLQRVIELTLITCLQHIRGA